MNKVILIGRLARDPEMRTTPSGVATTSFTIAVQRNYANAQGDREADFISCVAWRKQAENIAKYCSKGSQVAVEGRIQTRNYDAQDGTKRYVTEVIADNVSPADFQTNDAPKETNVSDDVFADFGSSIEISDDDIAK